MLRGGRFEKDMDQAAEEYQTSLESDIRIFDPVVQINIAHVHMLMEKDIIDKSSANKIKNTLFELRDKGIEELELLPELEDIHMVLEEYVNDRIGDEIGGKLHTAKSRNDQVSTAIRMYLREEILNIQELVADVIESIINLAKENTETVMPGYTHLQVAEPTTFGHYLCSYGETFMRDLSRLDDSYKQANKCPLGACALAGTSFPIDRELTSDLLGFDEILENTIDATGSRDYVLQVMSDISILMTNMSRLCEEISIWSSAEFDMLEIPDEFSSTSSIMPQKKNPVIAELERAKTGRTIGNLVGGFTLMKTLTQAYNLDLQELTPLLWDSIDQVKPTMEIMKKHIEKLKPKPEKMLKNTKKGYATMTELANTLVKETEIPFRTAHNIIGKLVSHAISKEKSLEDLTIEDLKTASETITGEEIELSEEEFKKSLDPEKSVELRDMKGGPAKHSVEKELSKLKEEIENQREVMKNRKQSLIKSKDHLFKIAKGD